MRLIAEIGWNHMGDLSLCKKMIEDATRSGATDVKLQFWQEKNLKQGPWDNDGRREIYKKAQLSTQDLTELQKFSNQLGAKFFFSVFDVGDCEAVISCGEFKSIKIPSHEVYNLELISLCCDNFEDVVISVGACSEAEFNDVMRACDGNEGVTILHCVSAYPCNFEDLGASKFALIQEACSNNMKIGFSDHTQSNDAALVFAGMGARTFERHFTSDKGLPGRDNKFAASPDEFAEYAHLLQSFGASLNRDSFHLTAAEKEIISNYRGRWSNQ